MNRRYLRMYVWYTVISSCAMWSNNTVKKKRWNDWNSLWNYYRMLFSPVHVWSFHLSLKFGTYLKHPKTLDTKIKAKANHTRGQRLSSYWPCNYPVFILTTHNNTFIHSYFHLELNTVAMLLPRTDIIFNVSATLLHFQGLAIVHVSPSLLCSLLTHLHGTKPLLVIPLLFLLIQTRVFLKFMFVSVSMTQL